jgi:hypothetical protein
MYTRWTHAAEAISTLPKGTSNPTARLFVVGSLTCVLLGVRFGVKHRVALQSWNGGQEEWRGCRLCGRLYGPVALLHTRIAPALQSASCFSTTTFLLSAKCIHQDNPHTQEANRIPYGKCMGEVKWIMVKSGCLPIVQMRLSACTEQTAEENDTLMASRCTRPCHWLRGSSASVTNAGCSGTGAPLASNATPRPLGPASSISSSAAHKPPWSSNAAVSQPEVLI